MPSALAAVSEVRFDGWGGVVQEAIDKYAFQPYTAKTGIKVTDEQRMQILLAVKAKSFEKKDLLTADEFKAIVNKVLNTNAALA